MSSIAEHKPDSATMTKKKSFLEVIYTYQDRTCKNYIETHIVVLQTDPTNSKTAFSKKS